MGLAFTNLSNVSSSKVPIKHGTTSKWISSATSVHNSGALERSLGTQLPKSSLSYQSTQSTMQPHQHPEILAV